MRKVTLSVNEQYKYEIIKSLIDHHGNKKRAAVQLRCTERHVNRLIKKYLEQGKAAFVHGNRGRKPSHAISKEKKTEIVTIYNNKYYDATFAYACELLAMHDDIYISPSTLTNILYDEYIPSPRSTKKTKRRFKKELKNRQKIAKTKKEKDKIQANIVAIEDAHSRRPRCANFGEMLQMDVQFTNGLGG